MNFRLWNNTASYYLTSYFFLVIRMFKVHCVRRRYSVVMLYSIYSMQKIFWSMSFCVYVCKLNLGSMNSNNVCVCGFHEIANSSGSFWCQLINFQVTTFTSLFINSFWEVLQCIIHYACNINYSFRVWYPKSAIFNNTLTKNNKSNDNGRAKSF